MSEQIFWLFENRIKDGQVDALNDLIADMSAATKADEPGTLNYEWFISEDNESCHIYERYADGAAALQHIEAFGEKFADRFMALLEPQGLKIYGDTDGAVKAALAALGARFHTSLGGFIR